MHDEWSVNHLTGGQLTSDVRVARLAARQHGVVTSTPFTGVAKLTERELAQLPGERVLRITHAQATTQAERTLARLRAAGAPYA